MPYNSPGRFITFEGGEGVGKSTQIRLLAQKLRQKGFDVTTTREPGGSPGAEAVRHVLLTGAAEEFGTRFEATLFAAARADHVAQVIRPAIEDGRVVLCDRFMDSTRVYQGATGNLEANFVHALERLALNGLTPDLTILLDMPAETGLARARARDEPKSPDTRDGATVSGQEGAPVVPVSDRFEREDLAIHETRRQAFLDLAESEPDRFRTIDADQSVEAIASAVLIAVHSVLPKGAQASRKAGGQGT
ncbi:dTMP kinase [Pararhizobium mangrovi]|uniref:Thymidylate kinase n=1 Tax=Pararhizobium mangrovi TaxID=2590452 RepID=A0A506UA71_9HYPH|nr:dTMP kinase [Pararhizobium mangrovi]TPW31332.1 dTMP kinase [Pararhizobium mangrovi]